MTTDGGATTPRSPQRQVDRYGRRPVRRSPAVRAVLVVLGLAVLVAATVVAYVVSRPDVQAAVTRWHAVDAHHVSITVEVHKAADATAVCVVRSRDTDGAETGRAEVTIPAGRAVTTMTYDLATRQTANSGEVQDCRVTATG